MEENREKLGNYEVVVYHLGDIFKTRDDVGKMFKSNAVGDEEKSKAAGDEEESKAAAKDATSARKKIDFIVNLIAKIKENFPADSKKIIKIKLDDSFCKFFYFKEKEFAAHKEEIEKDDNIKNYGGKIDEKGEFIFSTVEDPQ